MRDHGKCKNNRPDIPPAVIVAVNNTYLWRVVVPAIGQCVGWLIVPGKMRNKNPSRTENHS